MLREIEPLAAKHETLSYEIAEKLKESIYSGHFLPGGVLRETRLASEYKSSRTAVREALRILERLRLVELHSWRKANVAPLDSTRVKKIYELRAMLEALAVRQGMAKGKLTRQCIAEIKSLSKLFYKLAKKGEGTKAAKVDLALHWAWCSLCDNKDLLDCVNIYQALARHTIVSTEYYDFIYTGNCTNDHTGIIASIVAGDAERAEREVRDHINFEGEQLSELVRMVEGDWRC